MNIAYSQPTETGFRSDRKNKSQGKQIKGPTHSEVLEKHFCTEDISTQYNEILSRIDFNKVHPIAYSLLNIEWSFFGSLTWRNPEYRQDNPESERLRFKDFRLLIRRVCQLLHLNKDKIEYYVTSERGGSCECHLHFLIAKNGLQEVPVDKVILTLKSLWSNNLQLTSHSIDTNRTKGGRGLSKIDPFDRKNKWKLVAYICKRERDIFGREYPAVDRMSNALRERARKINAVLEEPPPITISPRKSIKNCFWLALAYLKSPLELVVSHNEFLEIKKDRDRFRTREPPVPSCKGWRAVCEKSKFNVFE